MKSTKTEVQPFVLDLIAERGIALTAAVKRELKRLTPEQAEAWLHDLDALGTWDLILIHGTEKAHIARAWSPGSNKIQTLCSLVHYRANTLPAEASESMPICKRCLRAAEKNEIRLKSRQPRLV